MNRVIEDVFVTFSEGGALCQSVCGNIFNATHHSTLFRSLLDSITARPYAPPMFGLWDQLNNLFCGYDAAAFNALYPPVVGESLPTPALITAFELTEIGFPAGHALPPLWEKFLASAQQGAAFLAPLHAVPADSQSPMTLTAALHICGFDFVGTQIDNLTIAGASRATERLRTIPGVAFAVAMNFLRDVGCANAFKPDIHTKRILSSAFAMGCSPHYPRSGPPDDDALSSDYGCFQAAMGFVKSLSRLCGRI